MKKNADKANHAQPRKITVGDKVLVRQEKHNKLTTPFDPKPYKVIEVKGTMIVAQRDDHRITRNSSHFKVLASNNQSEDHPTDSESDDLTDNLDQPQVDVQLERRYPLRHRKKPECLVLQTFK